MTLPVNMENKQPTAAMVNENGRRRFIRGVGAAAPLILTAHSPSALASLTCLSPSATASIALLHSRPNREQLPCTGRTPGYWYNAACTHPTEWAQAGGANKPFADIYSGGFISGGKKLTLQQVMGLTGGNPQSDSSGKKKSDTSSKNCQMEDSAPGNLTDPYQLGAHLSAAWLNWKMGWVPASVLDLNDLQKMWKDRLVGYEPIAGVKWYSQQIVAYLQSTMTL